MIFNKTISGLVLSSMTAASFFFSPYNTLAFEILESKTETIETFWAGDLIAKTIVEFELVKVKGVPTFSCDDHPDDPICDFYAYYYDNASFAYISKKRQAGFTDDFYPLDGDIDEVSWEEAKKGYGLEDGIVILYKTSGDKLSDKAFTTFLKNTLEKFID